MHTYELGPWVRQGLTVFIRFGILLQMLDKSIEFFLTRYAAFQGASLEFWIVPFEDFFFGGGDVVDEGWASYCYA